MILQTGNGQTCASVASFFRIISTVSHSNYASGTVPKWPAAALNASLWNEVDTQLTESKCVEQCKYGLCRKGVSLVHLFQLHPKQCRNENRYWTETEKARLWNTVGSPRCRHWHAHKTQGLILSQTGNSLHNPGNKQERTAVQFDWPVNGRCRYKAPL